jgi:hypothetical protein
MVQVGRRRRETCAKRICFEIVVFPLSPAPRRSAFVVKLRVSAVSAVSGQFTPSHRRQRKGGEWTKRHLSDLTTFTSSSAPLGVNLVGERSSVDGEREGQGGGEVESTYAASLLDCFNSSSIAAARFSSIALGGGKKEVLGSSEDEAQPIVVV